MEHSRFSPAGIVDAWGDVATGLRSNRRGRFKAGRMLLWLVAVVVVLVVLPLVLFD